ncbi:MAG: glycosyltransferase family 2 protein [Kiritimatiellia bacterium]
MPKVSVIMPVYQTEATVAAAIESVLAQTFADFELLCVNDGSPDNAPAILEEYAAKDRRVRVFAQENRGLSGARNTGLDRAMGDYVTFLDSDDALPRHALASFLSAAEATGAPVVVSERPVDVASAAAKRAAAAAEPPAPCAVRVSTTPLKSVIAARRMRSSAWNKLYRRETIGARRFIEGIYFEDWPFVTGLLANLDKAAIVSAPCYIYSMAGASIVRSAFNAKKVRSYEAGIRAVAAELKSSAAWPLARRRCGMAAAMMINKTAKTKDAALRKLAREVFANLRSEGILRCRDLPLKSLWRLAAL